MNNHQIDAVITWVDGYDPQHQAKLLDYLNAQKIKRPHTAAPTRFNQCGEINYCIKSILRYAPWIGTIYIVTDAQTPPIIQELSKTLEKNRIKLVDHRELFAGFEQNLPTFNSVAIESMLWRIEGLSEKFIYFNDDVSLVRPVAYEDFFREDKLILRGKWKLASDTRKYLLYKLFLDKLGFSKPKNLHRIVQENSAKLAGFMGNFFHLPHVPFPLRRKSFETFFAKHPELLSKNLSYQLRSPHQFLPISLAHHLELQNKTAIIDNNQQAVGINAGRYTFEKIKAKLKLAEKKEKVRFICIQSIDAAPPATQQFIFEWYDKHILQSSGTNALQ